MSGFTFTRITGNSAVLYGGDGPGGLSNAVYIINLENEVGHDLVLVLQHENMFCFVFYMGLHVCIYHLIPINQCNSTLTLHVHFIVLGELGKSKSHVQYSCLIILSLVGSCVHRVVAGQGE